MTEAIDAMEQDWYYKIRDMVQEREKIEDRWFSFTRGLKRQPFGESHKFDFLIEHFVDEILGKYDQDVSLLMVGNKGRGKSLCAQSLCYYAGCEIAERIGGTWQDYYNPYTNMAVILEEEANALMAIQTKYQVKNYDDIGIGWGARNWQDKDNKDKNDVFQINRTDATIQVFSVPNQFLLDKVPRSLVSHYAEMDQQFFDHGFTTIKMFKPETLFREGKIIQPYLAMDRTKYVLFRVPRPPTDLVDFYQAKRKANKTKATNTRMTDEEEVEKVRKNPSTMAMEQTIMEYSKEMMSVINAGGTKKDIIKMLVDELDLPKAKVTYWFKCGAMKRMGFEPC